MKQQGFSLIELVTVLLIITVLSTIAIRSTVDIGYSARYEQTKDRLNSIKQAIIGNPNRYLNGQPDIHGFVADMGRLPDTIRELIDMKNGYCKEDNQYTTKTNCETAGKTWVTLCSNNQYTDKVNCETNNAKWSGKKSYGFCKEDLTIDDESTCVSAGHTWVVIFYGGWQGPYLSVSDKANNSDTYTDGWGSESTDNNYGWNYAIDTPSADEVTLQSYGKDQNSGGTPPDYDADYPAAQPVLKQGDWKVSIVNGISAQFKTPLFSGICREDNVTQSACYNNAAHWENCLFLTPAQCTTTGGSWATDCRFTQTACTAKGGTWSATGNPQCVFDSTSCPGAGGTWSASDSLCVFTATACVTAGGADSRTCLFNSTSCSGTGKTWTATTHSCSFTSAKCLADSGIYTTSGANASCLRIYETPSTGAQYTESSCLASGNSWYVGDRSISICMKVYYRKNDGTIGVATSSSVTIDENGSYQTIPFSGFSTTDIPIGINAIGIYKHDGTACTINLYPSNRIQPIPVLFAPNRQLGVINW